MNKILYRNRIEILMNNNRKKLPNTIVEENLFNKFLE